MTKPKKKPEAKPTPPVAEMSTPGGGMVTIESHPFMSDGPPFVLAEDSKPLRIGSAEATLPLCGICGRRAEPGLRPCVVDGFRFVVTE